MRALILILLLCPLFVFSQTPDVYIKITDARGQQIKGEAVTKGFERSIQALTITSSGKNNTQLGFTMAISGASADLKRAMANGEILSKVDVSAVIPSGGAVGLSYTIKMEQVTVLSCLETMGCNGNMTTSVTLQAVRIGWTYYSQTKTGTMGVSRKFGWDAGSQSEWTNF